jgi:hypothetical protein
MTTIMTAITNLLKLTTEEYEAICFDAYFRWCQSVSITEGEFQMVLANASVNRYYNMEYAKCEAEFLQVVANYHNSPNIIIDDIMKAYVKCTCQMFNRRSKVLIDAAKKMKLEAILN